LSGKSLSLPKKKDDSEKTASLDRIDSNYEKGYLRGNVQWVHKDINRLKMNRSDDSFIAICARVFFHNHPELCVDGMEEWLEENERTL